MNLSQKDIRMLVELEQRMDAGTQPFVLLDGQRVAVCEEQIAEFGLKQGQTINLEIMQALLRFRLAQCEAQIAIKKARAPFQKAAGAAS